MPESVPIDLFPSLLFAVSALLVATFGFRPARQTTLRGAYAWILVALMALAAVELFAGRNSLEPLSNSWTTLRYVVGMLLLCPIVAVLGAKQPQDKAWHFIVASLWIVLVLPAAEAFFVRRGSSLQIHDTRGWFLWALMLTGLGNYLGTSRFVSAVGVFLSQVAYLAPFLPLLRWSESQPTWSGAWMLAAIVWTLVASRRPSKGAYAQRVWTDFRNSFGGLWTLRIAERVNGMAAEQGLEHRLEWLGFHGPEGVPPCEGIQKSLIALLGRFVSPQWLQERRGEEALDRA